MSRCTDIEPVWDRQCSKDADHVHSADPGDQAHQNTEVPGDTVTWGTRDQVRAYERIGHLSPSI